MPRASCAGPLRHSSGASGTRSSSLPRFFVESVRDWSDDAVVAAACDVLKYSGGYPTDANRRALYLEWLAVYASDEWNDSFDELMLLCIAFTPSPTSPTKPLFAECFKLAATADSWDPVLDTVRVTQVFNRRRRDADELLEELPEPCLSDRLSAFLAVLLSAEDSEALNEAGLLIGFCSLLLCAACTQNAAGAEAVFNKRSVAAPSSLFRTSFVGRVPRPSKEFLEGIRRKTASYRRLLIPYAVALPVALHVLLKKAEADAPKRDLAFLNSTFLTHTKFSGLEALDILFQFSTQTGLCVRRLNTLMSGDECAVTRGRVENYFRKSHEPGGVVQYSMPWCRLICFELFEELEVKHNIPYTLRIMSFLEQDRHSSLESIRRTVPDFAEITQADLARARQWASNFRVLLGRGLFRPGDCGGPASV
ncbi:uncharacterized protein LOC144141607 [Haemaphysalis longicornis]